jgi:hypothetical protein
MTLVATSLAVFLAAAAGELAPVVIQAPDTPVRIDNAKVLNIKAGEPAVLMYAATNLTDNDLEQFTVTAFIFDADGVLKTRQMAPGRRTLEKRSTKYSTMVLDGRQVTETDRIVVGVNQAQRTDSDKWWSAELEEAAKEAVKKPKQP